MGRLDPYCWLALGPLVLIAVVVFVSGVFWLGAVVVVLAVLLGVFDSWANRPELPSRPYRADQARTAHRAAASGPTSAPGSTGALGDIRAR